MVQFLGQGRSVWICMFSPSCVGFLLVLQVPPTVMHIRSEKAVLTLKPYWHRKKFHWKVKQSLKKTIWIFLYYYVFFNVSLQISSSCSPFSCDSFFSKHLQSSNCSALLDRKLNKTTLKLETSLPTLSTPFLQDLTHICLWCATLWFRIKWQGCAENSKLFHSVSVNPSWTWTSPNPTC